MPRSFQKRARAGERDEPPMLERGDWLDALRTPGTESGTEPGIASVEVLGAFQASAAVKSALADRTF